MKRKIVRGLYSPELLESRIAPATFLVTTTGDAGAGSLREAIDGIAGVGGANDSPGADTITFAPTILPGVIILTTGEIPILDTITIKGPGVDKLTVSGNNTSRIFNIDDGVTAVLHPATISGITFIDGNDASNGGAIKCREPLALKDAVFHSSDAGSKGGGVYVDTPGKISFNHVQFTDNTAGFSGGGAYVRGGAATTIVKSLFEGNASSLRGGGMELQAAGTKSTAVVDATTFTRNTAADDGGGLVLDHNGSGKLTLKNSTFTGNTAGNDGGALYLDDGKLTIDRTTFSRNSALYSGGAVADETGDELKITNSRFDGNTSGLQGGALYAKGGHPVSVTKSIFTGNASTTAGGAIHANSSVALTVKTSTFLGNTATESGGAIDITGSGTTLVLASSILSGNTGSQGGAVAARTGAALTVTGGVFSGNFVTGVDRNGGAINAFGLGADAVDLSITGTLFQGNRAVGSASDGGAVFAAGDGTIFVKGVRAIGNHAESYGGAMYLNSTTRVTLAGSLFQHNIAGDRGGGLSVGLISATAVGSITSSKFLDNLAEFGGGINLSGNAGSMLTIKSSTITGNVATVEGGGIRKAGVNPALTITGPAPTGNWAPAIPNGP